MIEALLLALGAVPSAACPALQGKHPDSVLVDQATLFPSNSGWRPEGRAPSSPVSVPFCRVEGHIEGNIGFELWLPVNWNGRLLGAGVGGAAGEFNYFDMANRLAEGFATVTTDSGHKSSDEFWMADTKARIDFEHRAVHLTAVAAKAIARKFYGRSVARSYFTGCSGGGRQGLKEIQTYSQDYDGVIAGAAGPTLTQQAARMLWFSLEQQRRPDAALTDQDWLLYSRKVVAQCDKLDGLTDGIVENPLGCRFDPAQLQCRPGQREDCLSAPKTAMLTSIISPFRVEDGRLFDHGLVPGVGSRPGPPSPLMLPMWRDTIHFGTQWDSFTFRPGAESSALARFMPELDANKTDLAAFIGRSGRAILYHGWQDASLNAKAALDYYSDLMATNDGVELDQHVRLFMVPGMYHCRGGPGADQFGASGHAPAPQDPSRDMLWALIRWVEDGIAPDHLIASKISEQQVQFTRMLCPFPQAARYYGGPATEASSFTCETDPLLANWTTRP
jgi:feruloyl esterase